jgi:hypothetical protein
MFKWFAPLLLFAAKPELVVRAVTVAIAAAVLAFGVWVLSNVALTFDALKNPYIATVYGAVLFCFCTGVGTITWLRFRRLAASAPLTLVKHVPEAPPLAKEVVSQRAHVISKRWARDSRLPASRAKDAAIAAPAARSPAVEPTPATAVRGTLIVTGPAYSGKSALIAVLVQATRAAAAESSDIVRLVDAGPIDGDAAHAAALVANAAAADGILFVVDQDLRAPEVAALARLAANAKPLYVVLNKMDQFNTADRDAILLSIRAKMPVKFAPGHVVSVASAPSPVEREIEDARGAVRLELRRPASDVRALTSLVSRTFPPAPGRTLRFEAA